MNEEFDFEKNLAMFDKHTVLAEIDQVIVNHCHLSSVNLLFTVEKSLNSGWCWFLWKTARSQNY